MTPRDLAEVLLGKAGQDAAAVRILFDNAAISDEIVGFHAHQAIEKSLKAVLTTMGVRAARTHDIKKLVQLLSEGQVEPPDWLQPALDLDPFAVTLRYAELEPKPLVDRAALPDLVDKALQWARELVQETDGS